MSRTLFKCQEHVVPAQHIRGYYRGTAGSEEEQLRLSVKQYTPLNNDCPTSGDVTIIACHAAGFFKEMYEPLFDELFQISQQRENNPKIRSIWIADVVTHGQSGLLNEGQLGHDYCWDDHARDLLLMTSIFRDQMVQPLVGLGHSMGAINIVRAALMHPRLFATIVCIEPPIFKEFDRFNYVEALWIIERNDIWASRQDAVRETVSGSLQRSWDQRVLKSWEQFAFRELPTLLYPEAPADVAREAKKQSTEPVTFSTSKHHAMRAFCRGAYPSPGRPLSSFAPIRSKHPDISKQEHDLQESPLYRPEVNSIFRQLPYLRPSCFSIFGSGSHFFSASESSRADKLSNTGTETGGSGGTKAGAVDDVVLEGVGHFAPFENPKRVAEAAIHWVNKRLEIWNAERALEMQTWDKIGIREKAMVEDDMRWWARECYSVKSSSRSKDQPAERQVRSGSRL